MPKIKKREKLPTNQPTNKQTNQPTTNGNDPIGPIRQVGGPITNDYTHQDYDHFQLKVKDGHDQGYFQFEMIT